MRALIADIINHAARISGVSAQDIRGKSRLRHVVRVRQAVCLIAREQVRQDGDLVLYAYSFPQIGAALGNKDHSTIIHGCKAAANIATRDREYAQFIDNLRVASASGAMFEASPKPVKKAVLWVIPSNATPRLKLPPVVRQWEEIELPSEHKMRLDQDGWTQDDINSQERIIAGSKRLAAAIQQARAA